MSRYRRSSSPSGPGVLNTETQPPPLLGRNVNCPQIIVLIIERRFGVRNAWEIDTMCVPKLRVLSPAKWGVGGGGPSKSRGSGTKWKTGQRRDMKIRTKCVIDYKVTSWVCFVKTFDLQEERGHSRWSSRHPEVFFWIIRTKPDLQGEEGFDVRTSNIEKNCIHLNSSEGIMFRVEKRPLKWFRVIYK